MERQLGQRRAHPGALRCRPARHAERRRRFSDNVSPHLAWSELPAATRSLVLICHDFDVPEPRRRRQPGRAARSRPTCRAVDFFHWLLVDLPAAVSGDRRGRLQPRLHGPRQSRAGGRGAGLRRARATGINDYTGWFAADADMAGDYFGYDGPFPPWNDSLIHHYVFTLYALTSRARRSRGASPAPSCARRSIRHVLAEATHSGTYTLNRRLL